MSKNRFYLACFRDNVGSNVSFHKQGFCGYSTDIDQANVCTLIEAQAKYDHAREFEVPLSAVHVDELSIWKVDHQRIPSNQRADLCSFDHYVAYLENKYDGNDVYWLNKRTCEVSTDFSKATVFTASEASELDEKYILIEHSSAQKARRRTFDFNLVNYHTMVKGAGLIKPEHLKKQKKASSKSKFNCPVCGKINWQHNPHDFEGCSDPLCDGGLDEN